MYYIASFYKAQECHVQEGITSIIGEGNVGNVGIIKAAGSD